MALEFHNPWREHPDRWYKEYDETVNSVRNEYDNIRITLKEVEGRLKSLAELVKQAEIYRRHRDLYKQYHSLSGNKADMFRIRNYTEIALYETAEKYLKENVNGSTVEVGKWKSDIAVLTERKDRLYSEMYKKRDEIKLAESVQKSVDTTLKQHTRKRNIEYERWAYQGLFFYTLKGGDFQCNILSYHIILKLKETEVLQWTMKI